MRLLALLLAGAIAAPSRAQAPSPHAIDVPRWFTDTFLELRDDVREAAARELRVAYTPTIVFFDRGKEVLRLDTYLRPFHLASALDYVASGAYRKEPSFQRYLQARTLRLRERGDKVDLWN